MFAGSVAGALLLAGCTSGVTAASGPISVSASTTTTAAAPAGTDAPRSDPAPDTSPAVEGRPLGAGFLGAGFPGTDRPTPEATVRPEPGSWDDVMPPAGYRVVLISAGDTASTATIADTVKEWAAGLDVDLVTLTAQDDDQVEARINRAVALRPDLVIGAGHEVVDVFALLTAQHLDQEFLVLGAELPEPTGNVTSVVWPGATFRGTGLSAAGEQDAAAVTPARAHDAVTAGVAGVLHGLTGIVLDLG
ncbi:BMP family ABC transporter substrate-binding protein [Nakamurella silvestris]|nr:BMP family ABC transporter substrate-binding protein [Nakamurella silvestris]